MAGTLRQQEECMFIRCANTLCVLYKLFRTHHFCQRHVVVLKANNHRRSASCIVALGISTSFQEPLHYLFMAFFTCSMQCCLAAALFCCSVAAKVNEKIQ
eukprot:14641-Heterococcus_DN1.PRE.2